MWAAEILASVMDTFDGLMEWAGMLVLILWYLIYLEDTGRPMRVRGYFQFDHGE